MKILIIGGTRLLGKKIVNLFVEESSHEIYILSRKANIYKGTCNVIETERSKGIVKLENEEFDIILDFIAYDENAVEEVTTKIKFKKYILISSCWMTKLNKKYSIDEFIGKIDEDAVNKLPKVTQNYLVNKLAAENYLRDNLPLGSFHIFRLPIFWGQGDHTKRLAFYVSRFLDNHPIIMINNGNNFCQITNVDDLSDHIFRAFKKNILFSQPILEALPYQKINTKEILSIIAAGLNSESRLVGINEEILNKELPEYLEAEPLWREDRIELSKNNIFSLLNSKSELIEKWLVKLTLLEAKEKFTANNLRSRELQLIKAFSE